MNEIAARALFILALIGLMGVIMVFLIFLSALLDKKDIFHFNIITWILVVCVALYICSLLVLLLFNVCGIQDLVEPLARILI